MRLRAYGHEDFTGYVVWTCERALERGLLPHTNLGVLGREDLSRLREVTASQGLMLESASERLMETVHAGSPTKHPRRRLQTIRDAGELRIPSRAGFSSGSGRRPEERLESLEAIAALHREHGHIQEVILQNFVPHQRYYGREPAEIADAAARAYWRTGIDQDGGERPQLPQPGWASAVSIEDMKQLIAHARRLMPDVGIQVPPNLAEWWPELVAAGATDLGGLSANGDHISPSTRSRPPTACARSSRPTATRSPSGCASTPATSGRTGSPRGSSTRSRRATGASSHAAARAAPIRRRRSAPTSSAPRSPAAGQGSRSARMSSRRCSPRPGPRRSRTSARRPTSCARSSPASSSRSWSTATSTSPTSASSGARSAASARAGARRMPTSTIARTSSAASTRRSSTARASCASSRASTRTGSSRTTSAGSASPGTPLAARAQTSTCTRTARWRSRTCATSPACPRRGVRRAQGRRPRLHPRDRRGGPPRRRPRTDLPEQAPRRPLGRDHPGQPRSRPALHRHRHVRPHRGAVGARRAHAGGARAPGAHGRHHRVRPALVHPLPNAARTHPRRRGDLARGEPQAHRRVPPRARRHRRQRPGELGQDGPRRRHRVPALGRQRPRGHPDGGVDQPARRQLSRHQARPRTARGRRPPRPPAGRRAEHPVRLRRRYPLERELEALSAG